MKPSSLSGGHGGHYRGNRKCPKTHKKWGGKKTKGTTYGKKTNRNNKTARRMQPYGFYGMN